MTTEAVVIGLDAPDDAGVYRLPDGTLLVQSVDFFTPVVDDPFDWGRISAANALSDIYAMGGSPLTAMQLASWPRDALPLETLAEVQRGGVEVLNSAGCVLLGGHSIDDREPKYGLAVTGIVQADRLLRTGGAEAGDALLLTKPLGTGVISTAIKRGLADPGVIAAAVASMVALNAGAAQVAQAVGATAATDVTGFGLLGHLAEMTSASNLGAVVRAAAVPVLPGAAELAAAGIIAGGSRRNRLAAESQVDMSQLDEATAVLITDAQTSGGLLLAVPAGAVADAIAGLEEVGAPVGAVIGEFVADAGIQVVPGTP